MKILFEIEKDILCDVSHICDTEPKNQETIMVLMDLASEEDFGDIQTVIDRDGNFAYGLGNDLDGHRLVVNIFRPFDEGIISNLNYYKSWVKITEDELKEILESYMDEYCS